MQTIYPFTDEGVGEAVADGDEDGEVDYRPGWSWCSKRRLTSRSRTMLT
jgi:hypothetical protein